MVNIFAVGAGGILVDHWSTISSFPCVLCCVCHRVCRRVCHHKDCCLSHQNRLCQTLHIREKEYMGLGKCTGWPFHDLAQGHGCGIDWQKFANSCLHDKMRTTHPISIELESSFTPLVRLITWLDLGEILLVIFYLANFIQMCFGCVF